MFVRHITERDVFDQGFVLNPLTNETFSRQKIDTTHISTYMQVWIDINSYRFCVVTDREGEVERGVILTKDILRERVQEFFDNDVLSFLKRKLPEEIERLKQMTDTERKQLLLNRFGDSYEL